MTSSQGVSYYASTKRDLILLGAGLFLSALSVNSDGLVERVVGVYLTLMGLAYLLHRHFLPMVELYESRVVLRPALFSPAVRILHAEIAAWAFTDRFVGFETLGGKRTILPLKPLPPDGRADLISRLQEAKLGAAGIASLSPEALAGRDRRIWATLTAVVVASLVLSFLLQ